MGSRLGAIPTLSMLFVGMTAFATAAHEDMPLAAPGAGAAAAMMASASCPELAGWMARAHPWEKDPATVWAH